MSSSNLQGFGGNSTTSTTFSSIDDISAATLMDQHKIWPYDNDSSSNERARSLLAEYFDDPTMHLVKRSQQGDFCIYMVKSQGHFMNKTRYLIAIVPSSTSSSSFLSSSIPPKTARLSTLAWSSFQTRSLQENHEIPSHSYMPKRRPGFDQKLLLVEREHDHTTYDCPDLPQIQVTLVHHKTNQINDYPDEGKLNLALETFNTVLTLLRL